MQVDVAIITMKPEEFVAVLEAFETLDSDRQKGEKRDYQMAVCDTPSGVQRVAVTRSLRQGNIAAYETAMEVIDDLQPSIVLVVGIAGGVPTVDFTLGDVLVSTCVYDLTFEEVGVAHTRFDARGGALHPAAGRVVERLPATLREAGSWASKVGPRPSDDGSHTTSDPEWNRRIDEAFAHHRAQGARLPSCQAAGLASSDRLIKDPELIAAWRTVVRGAVAVEMESAGAYAACHRRGVPYLAVRGISDVVGWSRNEDWTRFACRTAATLTRAMVGAGSFADVPRNVGAHEGTSQSLRTPSALPAIVQRDDRDLFELGCLVGNRIAILPVGPGADEAGIRSLFVVVDRLGLGGTPSAAALQAIVARMAQAPEGTAMKELVEAYLSCFDDFSEDVRVRGFASRSHSLFSLGRVLFTIPTLRALGEEAIDHLTDSLLVFAERAELPDSVLDRVRDFADRSEEQSLSNANRLAKLVYTVLG